VLYEMLTRALPFEGESLGAVLLKQLNEKPKPPSYHVPELSPALDRFVLKCLSPQGRQRFADAGQALAALSLVGPWSRPRWAKLRQAAVPAATAVLLGGMIVLAAVRRLSIPSRDAAPAPVAVEQAPVAQQVVQGLAPAPAAPPVPTVEPAGVGASPALEAPALEAPGAEAVPLETAPLASSAAPPSDGLGLEPKGAPGAAASGAASAAPLAPAAAIAPAAATPKPAPAPGDAPPPSAAAPPLGADAPEPPGAAPEASPADPADPGWKPTRVPKRLSSPPEP